MYGIQTRFGEINSFKEFENDVKMYGIQTLFFFFFWLVCSFENDVKMYGIQTQKRLWRLLVVFENDVKMYGIQTEIVI